MISKEELNARAIRLSGGRVNRYTGTPNDPHADAMSNYAGPGWGGFGNATSNAVGSSDVRHQPMSTQVYGAPTLFGAKVRSQPMGTQYIGGPALGGGEDMPLGRISLGGSRQSLAAMRGAEDLNPLEQQDQKYFILSQQASAAAEQAKREVAAQKAYNDDEADRAQADREQAYKDFKLSSAMAIANDPGVSQYGRPIVGANGTYQTAAPDPNAPPVNRQAVAAQMAPGLIPPPAPPKPVTFGKPEAAMVTGPDGKAKRVFVREGSDGLMYDTARNVIPPEALVPAGDGNEPLVSIMGPDNRPILVPRSQAVGKTPASSREQGRPVTSGDAGRVTELDTSLDDLKVLRQTLGTTGAGSKVGAMLPNVVTEYTGWGADSKSRQGTIDRVKQVIGKALEGGVLRKEDEVKYEKILPTIGDAPDVAKAKLDGLEKALVQRRQRTLESLADAGYETSRFEERGGGTVELIAPDGGILDVPAADVEKLLKADPKLKRKGGG
jgi:hypothetical protein